ncbi:MAG TPA: choice-of-anchor tandem repeat GloVer-containing protein [Candidatus Sulfotelmatobacter sp.]|jgi:uncharacterized repeat protein (TIGR03803 family)
MKRKSLPAIFVHSLLAAVVLFACQTFATAGTETVLHQFVNVGQGAFPGANLVQDAQGNVYGTTSSGGTYGFGVVFKLSRNSSGKWQQKVLHNFTGLTDGFQPNSLAIDAEGNLFGATTAGGSTSYSTYGYGVVFELSPETNGSWAFIVLHDFAGGTTDGSAPAGILLDSLGNVYGVATGGIENTSACGGPCGLVFRLSPSNSGWTESFIYKFQGQADGGIPAASLAIDSAGNLYGATTAETLPWTVFKLTPASSHWTETTLFTMADSQTQGGRPNGVTLDSAGNIYGTSAQGGVNNDGVVFELVRGSGSQYTESVLHVFAGGNDGNSPYGTVSIDSAGNLYGTTYGGGSGSTTCASCGTVYRLSPSLSTWKETILHDFVGETDGANPQGAVLIDPSGDLIGTTRLGTEANFGTVFELAGGSYNETQVYGFPATDGAQIRGGLVEDAAGNFYGVAATGGVNQCPLSNFGCGLIFKLSRQSNGTWARTIIHNFTGTQNGDGDYPQGSLIFDSAGNLYGTTSNSVYGGGTVFKLTPTASGGWSFRTIYEFGRHNHSDGASPWGTLVMDKAGNLYGTTVSGGTGSYLNCNYCGTVFKLAPTSNHEWTESVIYNFQGLQDGSFPIAGLSIDAAGNLYGTTAEGGIGTGDQGLGVVFKLSPNSTGTWTQSVLYTFTGGLDGAGPNGGVILDSAGNLYGTTPTGGPVGCGYGCGVVYKLTPTTSGPWTETVIYPFAGVPDGTIPLSTLTWDAAGNLYGTTEEGGSASNIFCFGGGCGTVFKLAPSAGGWTESVLYSFNGPASDGADPFAGVILDSAGKIYGTTSVGGINGYTYENGGTVFEITP